MPLDEPRTEHGSKVYRGIINGWRIDQPTPHNYRIVGTQQLPGGPEQGIVTSPVIKASIDFNKRIGEIETLNSLYNLRP